MRTAPVHELPDEELLAFAVGLAGDRTEVYQEVLGVALPVLRADMTAFDTYIHTERPPLSVAITSFAGDADRYAPAEVMPGWRDLTTGPFRAETLPGGHFYFRQQEDRLLSVVRDQLHLTTR